MHNIIDDSELRMQVGGNIEYIRLLRKKTIKEVAALIKLTTTGYRNIERGITDISVTKLFHLAAILEVNHTQLLELDLKNFIEREEHEKLSAKYVKQIEENHRLRIQQYKEENNFLKKQIEVLEKLMANNESDFEKTRRYPRA